MEIRIFGLAIDTKLLGILVMAAGLIILIASFVYNIVFRINKVKREYRILENEGMFDVPYTSGIDAKPGKNDNPGKMPAENILRRTKKQKKNTGKEKPVQYMGEDLDFGILNDKTDEFETLPSGRTLGSDVKASDKKYEYIEEKNINAIESLMDDEDCNSKTQPLYENRATASMYEECDNTSPMQDEDVDRTDIM